MKIFMDMRKGKVGVGVWVCVCVGVSVCVCVCVMLVCKVAEGAATLRMKQDYTSPNPNM